jgi:hypothetical protein
MTHVHCGTSQSSTQPAAVAPASRGRGGTNASAVTHGDTPAAQSERFCKGASSEGDARESCAREPLSQMSLGAEMSWQSVPGLRCETGGRAQCLL